MFNTEETLKELCDHKIDRVDKKYNNHRRQYILHKLKSIINNDIILDTYAIDAQDERINIIAPVIKTSESNESIFLIAHYDVVNIRSDNCLDNSVSIVNVLHLISLILENPPKQLKRSLYVCFTDGEEKGGIGAAALAKRIQTGKFGNVPLVINLECSGEGDIIAIEETELRPISSQLMQSLNATVTLMPFNDSVKLRHGDVHSVCLALAVQKNNQVVFKHLECMHTINDSINLANIEDMNSFVYKLKSSIFQLLQIIF